MISRVLWVGLENKEFYTYLDEAFETLEKSLDSNKFKNINLSNLITEIKHFETKELFDQEMINLSGGSLTQVPTTYVALMDSKVLRII